MKQDDSTVVKCLNENRPEAIDLDALISSFSGQTAYSAPNLFITILCTMARLHLKLQHQFGMTMIFDIVGTPDYADHYESKWQLYYIIGEGGSIGMIEMDNDFLTNFATIERSHFDNDILKYLQPWKTIERKPPTKPST